MNFAFVCHLDPEDVSTWSGIPHFIIKTLRELGHSVTSVSPKDSSWHLGTRIRGRIYRHFFGKVYHAGRSPTVLRRQAKAFDKKLEKLSQIDYVLTIFPRDAAFLKPQKPIVVIHDATWHQLIDFYPGLEQNVLANETVNDGHVVDMAALRNCKKAAYFSPWACASAVDDMNCEARKVRAIAPGANLDKHLSKLQVLQIIKDRSKDRCKLLFIGQDWQRKGAAKAIAITKCLNDLGTIAEIYIVGCSAPKGEILPEFVHVLGFLKKGSPSDRKKIEQLFATSHFFVLPTMADCTPIVMCEAAVYGIPCLSHNVGGVSAIVQTGKNGQLFSLNSQPLEWAQWLHELFNDSNSYLEFATRSLEDAHARLNWGSFCQGLIEFLRS